MPGYELIGKEEQREIDSIFKNGNGVLFRHGFENIRNNSNKVLEFERNFAKQVGSKYALAVTSGTAALRVALASLNIKKGDEVITQAFTFVATVESIVESGATPICTEIDKTLNMDPDDLLKKINKKTKAVIVVHMLGVPARLEKIKKICKKQNISLIEDTAWGCGGSYKNKSLGTWGEIGAYSFDFAKTLTTGEGGMLVFKDKNTFLNAKAWHDHGHENNPKYPRWLDTRRSSGFNFRMSELQGAVGIAQLKKLKKIIKLQNKNMNKIKRKLSLVKNIEFREIIEGSNETADALIFFVKNKKRALFCREELLKQGVGTKILPEAYTWHFAGTWKHIPSLWSNLKNKTNAYPKSISLLEASVSIPINIHMEKDIPEKVYQAVNKVMIRNN